MIRRLNLTSPAVARAWVGIPCSPYAYHYALGEFGLRPADRSQPLAQPAPGPESDVLRAVTECVAGIRRFGGRGLDDLSHSLVVRAALPPDASRAAKLHALTHDHHEALVCDLPTPLKRLLEACGDTLWREVEQLAARAVERLAGIEPTAADREAVRVADQIALRVEARTLGIDLGDPADFGADAAERAADVLEGVQAFPDEVRGLWAEVWANDGGAM